MAEPISIQQLKDASEDAITLADFIYKPANVMIPRRLAADINSLQYYLDYMSSYAQHSYETYDEMVANAPNLPNGVSAFVTNDLDTTNNGIYTYNGVSFIKGDYQPENAAKDYVEAKLGGLQVFEGKVRAQDVSTADGSTQAVKNEQYDLNTKVVENISELLLIPVQQGLRVTVKGSQGGVFEYNSSKASLNDGGTVFNGWVRIHFLTHNLVEWFGAKWDGTDTTAELDKAIIESAKTKTVLNFGGSDRTYTINTMRHISGWQCSSFLIQNDMHLVGQGCKIIVDNRATPYPDEVINWAKRIFTVSTENDGVIAQYVPVENVTIDGIDFDTQYDKYSIKKQDVAVFISSGMILNNILIKNCEVRNGGGSNTFGCYTAHNNSEIISKNWKILDCRIINSGQGYDHSPVYIMADDAEVKVDILQQFNDPVKNLWAANAIEIHGSNQNIHHCLIDKVGGGIISGINYNARVDNTSINNNIINSYSGAITIWNGEDVHDKGHGNVSITNNTIRILPHLLDGYRKGIGNGQLGNSINSLVISGNHITCEDAVGATTSSKPIDLWYIGGGIGFGAMEVLSITGNTCIGSNGIHVRSDTANMSFINTTIKSNTIHLTHSVAGTGTNIGVYVKNSPSGAAFNNLNTIIRDNNVSTNVPNNTICYEVDGATGVLSIENFAPHNCVKYRILTQPSYYVDSESPIRPTNINGSIHKIRNNSMTFRVNVATMQKVGTENQLWLCTMPVGSKVDSVYTVQQSKISPDTINAGYSVGDDVTKNKYLWAVSFNTVGSGTRVGFTEDQKGTALKLGNVVFVDTLENISLHIDATDLSSISGTIDVTINFSYV